jgi:hypothetical protein
MIDQNVTITDNLVTKVAEDYKDMSGILSTYASHTVIEHNEVSDLAYDGIDVGWGWGANDAGGSQDYANRGLYNYQPVYTTPTTLKNTVVSYNLVHGTKKVLHDGGSIYNLSANPGAVINDNYIYDNDHTVGLYLDEGSRYVSLTNNVVQDTGVWAFTNANPNNTDDNTFTTNWYNTGATQVATGAPHNNVLNGDVQVTGRTWAAGRPAGDLPGRHRTRAAHQRGLAARPGRPRAQRRAGLGQHRRLDHGHRYRAGLRFARTVRCGLVSQCSQRLDGDATVRTGTGRGRVHGLHHQLIP